jgi:hypothetical protein
VAVEDLRGVVRRRWLVVLVGLILTAVLGLLTLRMPGVYWASTKVLFLVPASEQQPNQLAPDNSSAIAFAGVIETEINGGVPFRRATSPDVTLVDEGIFDGWSVLMPDTGGQWAHNFAESSLIVQASGPSAEVVQNRMNDLIGQITALVRTYEDTAHVSADDRVDLTMAPTSVRVQYSNGSRSHALAVIILLGFVVSLVASVLADRIAVMRRRRGSRTSDSVGDARVRDAAGGDQDGAGREGAGTPPAVAADRGGDRAAPGDA